MANVDHRREDRRRHRSRGNNAPVTTVYEPGSVMKIVDGLRAPSRRASSRRTRPFTVPGQPARSATTPSPTPSRTATETMTVAQILAQSSNIGTIKIAQKLGKQALYDTLTDFGFGQRDRRSASRTSPTARCPAPDTWSDHVDGHHPDRPGRVGHADAGALGLQHDRQRRHLRGPPPGRHHHRRRRQGAPDRRPTTGTA